MSTLLALPTLESCQSAGEVLAPEPQPIVEYHTELIEAARAFRMSSMRIAFFGFRMRLSDGWTAMGYEPGPRGEEAYRESLGIPRSTWYKQVRIGQALHYLPLEDLERIPVGNAELLVHVDPSIQHNFPWVSEAKSLPADQLAVLVTSRNKQVGNDREPLVSMVFRIPSLAKSAVEEMIETFQHKHELSSKGQALEMLVAERHDRGNLLASVFRAKQLLEGVVLSMQRRRATETEESTWLAMAKEILDASYEEAVQASRQKAHGDQDCGGPGGLPAE